MIPKEKDGQTQRSIISSFSFFLLSSLLSSVESSPAVSLSLSSSLSLCRLIYWMIIKQSVFPTDATELICRNEETSRAFTRAQVRTHTHVFGRPTVSQDVNFGHPLLGDDEPSKGWKNRRVDGLGDDDARALSSCFSVSRVPLHRLSLP